MQTSLMLRRNTLYLLTLLSFAGTLTLTLVIYWSGLTGTFLFDTIPNLSPLKDLPDDPSIKHLFRFVLSGTSGPTGRPVALLSFLINDSAWPTTSFPFKYTNLLLHLINGVLVFWLTHRLLATIQYEKPLVVAMLTCLIWLIHPLQISTVLYVVQRMTELSTLFTLVALIIWLYGRESISRGDIFATWRTTLLIMFSGLLALFSKENGALIPLYILALEIAFNSGNRRSASLNRWLIYFAVLPTLLLIAYFLYQGLTTNTWEWRSYSLTERLLTEARALSNYLFQIMIPRIHGAGLFHDDFPVSTSLLKPVETLPSVLFILTLAISAWHLRRRRPLYSFAIAWFFAGHMMESSVLPLELYIEHRNYLPMMGILLALVTGIFTLTKRLRKPSILLLTGYIAACAGQTYLHTDLWGKPIESATIWAKENPESLRAQLTAVSIIDNHARNTQATREWREEYKWRILGQAIKHHPKDAGLLVIQLIYRCENGSIDQFELDKTKHLLTSAKLVPPDLAAIRGLTKLIYKDLCGGILSLNDVLDLLHAAEKNPITNLPIFQHYLSYLQGEIYMHQGNLDRVMYYYDRAYLHQPLVDIRLQQIYYLYTAGLYSDATQYLDNLIIELNWRQSFLYEEEVNALRKQIYEAQQHSAQNEN